MTLHLLCIRPCFLDEAESFVSCHLVSVHEVCNRYRCASRYAHGTGKWKKHISLRYKNITINVLLNSELSLGEFDPLDIHRRSQTSNTSLCNGIVSNGDQIGFFFCFVFTNNTGLLGNQRKQNMSKYKGKQLRDSLLHVKGFQACLKSCIAVAQ